jgi:MFS family permease
MGRRRQLVIGLAMLIGGLVVVASGTIFPSSNPLVALGWLLVVPLLVSFCGTIFIFVSLMRSTERVRRSATVYRILGLAAVAGLGLALGSGAAGIVSQVPDSLAGLNGSFVPGSAPGLAAFILGGLGLSVGLAFGAVAALVWWSFRARHLPPEMSSSR